MTFAGPSPELQHRIGLLHHSPVMYELSYDEQDALKARLVQATDFEDLSAEDQALIVRGERLVADGASETLQDPADWPAFVDPPDDDPAADPAEGAESKADQLAELPSIDDAGWVGL